jgi:hypothetical protein
VSACVPCAAGVGCGWVCDRKSKGWLKVCSKSLVFEPHDPLDPLIKLCYRDCTQIAERSRDLRVVPEVFGVTCERVQEMRTNNVVGPYVVRKVRPWGARAPDSLHATKH